MPTINPLNNLAVPAYDLYAPRDVAARATVADTQGLRQTAEAPAQTFVRSNEEIRRFPGYDEIRQIEELVTQEGGRTDVQNVSVQIIREPRPEGAELDPREPGQLLDLTI